MKNNFTFLIGLIFFISSSVFAQEATISGKLLNKAHNEPLPFATLKLTSSKGDIKGIFSGENGEFLFSNLMPDTYSLEVSAVGFENLIKSAIVISEKNQTLKFDELAVQAKINNLAEVVVKSNIGVTKVEPQKIVYTTAD
ncbi:MAG: carboxypeptidase-like regulatory domain-containing protein, partial [Spirosomaceae bacterium]|nr:carboxypeptidase-like regulatory domain-containing protein [Spirosomataceae bacterium]